MLATIPVVLSYLAVCAAPVAAQRLYEVRSFERQQLTAQFFSEGATAGDFDGDEVLDIVAGPYWYAGPAFEEAREIYPPKAFDPARYSDNFFAFTHDLNADGWTDVLVVGFPGQDASWFENPRGEDRHWIRHKVFDGVDNESPTFTDLTGDGRPELVCQHSDRLGYASVDWDAPEQAWKWHPISVQGIGGRFTHGLGVGDVDGDGRKDVLWKHGWWQQPASLEGDPQWQGHLVNFAGRGGAQMFAFDVDGDGDNDVVSAENAHGYGLYWFEHRREDGKIVFDKHLIMGRRRNEAPHRIAVGNLHAMAIADVDRDGLPDLVTGNRYWAHSGNDPADRDPPEIYWFELVRENGTARFVPHQIDSDSGVGTQVVTADVNGDGHVDVVVGNKMGAFVHRHRVQRVTAQQKRALERRAATKRIAGDKVPHNRRPGRRPKLANGEMLNAGFETGDLRHWTADGEAFREMPIRGDTVAKRRRDMQSKHVGQFWVGGYEPKHSDEPQGRLTSAKFQVDAPFASFLVGGGHWDETRVELVRADTGDVFFQKSGRDDEALAPVVVDLADHRGQDIYIRLVDDRKGHWAHINFDDFLFHDSRPPFAEPVSIHDQKKSYTAEEARVRMQVPDGFRVDLFAAEPDVQQPVGFAIDEKGRLWVAEAYAYPRRRKDGEGRDAIVVFEDLDNDGRFDNRTVFADDLNLISGIEFGFGGVWVGAAPYLMFIPDKDGDLKPDGEPEILLDGWHHEDTHETLNAFIWGPDGWLYGCHGVFTYSNVGKPGTPAHERQPINAGVWRYHPTKHEFEVFAWGTSNPWGVDFDEHGDAFITACVIPHAYHMIQGGRYQRQSGRHFNPHVYDDIKTIADHLHFTTRNPHAGNQKSDAVGGGHAHCGAMIYRGGRFPREFDGSLFMNNVHGHRVITDTLHRSGSGYVASHGPEFLVSNDKWFMGINLKYGSDGNVYLIDWYDNQNCHLNDPQKWDRSNGRIYKVSYGDAVAAPNVDLQAANNEQLVEHLFHENNWYGRRARRVLQERGQDAQVAAALESVVRTDRDETRQLRALWGLHVTGGLGLRLASDLLESESEYVRAWTVQLLLEDRRITDQHLAQLETMALHDDSPVVRRFLASALQRLPEGQRWKIAEGLLGRVEDVDDHNLPLLIWYGIEPAVPTEPRRALELARTAHIPVVAEYIVRRLAAEGGGALAAVLDAIVEADVGHRRAMLAQVRIALANQADVEMPPSWPKVFAELSKTATGDTLDVAMEIGAKFGDASLRPRLIELARNAALPAERRVKVFDLAFAKPDAAAVGVLHELVDDAALGGAAIRALARVEDAKTADILLARLPRFSAERRRAAVSTLVGRESFALRLLDAVASGDVSRAVLDAPARLVLKSSKSERVRQRLDAVWGASKEIGETARATIERFKRKLPKAVLARADLSHGRAMFEQTCAACHVLFGVGGKLGPDITGSNRRDLDYLLSNIVEPSAELSRDYMMATVTLKSGEVVAGMIAEENDSAVTVRNIDVSQVLARGDIDSIDRLEISLMPPGQLEGMRDDDVRDLIAYLGSDRQVPLEASADNVAKFFDGESLAFWNANPDVWRVENGEIIGSAPQGLRRNDFAISELRLRDFKFTVDIKLKDDVGNSGIQFRSVPIEGGEMRGYQADIGPGWWGKLYEESARGLLSDKSGEAHVKKGEWNCYEIEAVGDRVRTWINGQLCVDRTDPKGAPDGVIGLQVHSGGPTEVRFRKLKLELR